MAETDALLDLAKLKLNITWSDSGTDSRVKAILEEAVPAVANMVALSYKDGEAYDGEKIFDFAAPSIERNLLMNYIAYEWNHQADLFRDAYKEDISACRKKRVVEEASNGDSE